MIILIPLVKSKDKTAALKLPTSVATVIVLSPAPGGPETGFGVGVDKGTSVGVGVGAGAGVGTGVSVGVGLGIELGLVMGSVGTETSFLLF